MSTLSSSNEFGKWVSLGMSFIQTFSPEFIIVVALLFPTIQVSIWIWRFKKEYCLKGSIFFCILLGLFLCGSPMTLKSRPFGRPFFLILVGSCKSERKMESKIEDKSCIIFNLHPRRNIYQNSFSLWLPCFRLCVKLLYPYKFNKFTYFVSRSLCIYTHIQTIC